MQKEYDIDVTDRAALVTVLAVERSEGKTKGKIEGKREGKREGKIEGKREGKREGLLTAARVLKKRGDMTDAVIASDLGLAESEVSEIKVDNKEENPTPLG